MNRFDTEIVLFLNHFVNRWAWFDWFIVPLLNANLLKGVVIVLLAWYAMFDGYHGEPRKGYERLLGAMLLSPLAVIAARSLALLLPFRARPVWTPGFPLTLPPAYHPDLLRWSSFPSDHAVLFFMIATAILFVSRPLGWLAIGWVSTVVCFPRIYLGVHWPTDIIGGALLGIGFAYLLKIGRISDAVRSIAEKIRREHPGAFFAALFLLSYNIGTLFSDSRHLARALWSLVKH